MPGKKSWKIVLRSLNFLRTLRALRTLKTLKTLRTLITLITLIILIILIEHSILFLFNETLLVQSYDIFLYRQCF